MPSAAAAPPAGPQAATKPQTVDVAVNGAQQGLAVAVMGLLRPGDSWPRTR
ncbi:MAG: hypothetical protein GAK38_00287 [Xylophilus sp.]|nr:MAG: hypothetical protein GAK38_00287 [Xylophilus sp.]